MMTILRLTDFRLIFAAGESDNLSRRPHPALEDRDSFVDRE
jgi:hypothetical protein